MHPKPKLCVDMLQSAGFSELGVWITLESGQLALNRPAPAEPGVYAFARDGLALYVGVATSGLKGRMRSYCTPGPTQRTSQRLNAQLKMEVAAAHEIRVYVAMPPDLTWNGLPIHGSAGLELGLIRSFALPWNLRSAGHFTHSNGGLTNSTKA